MSAFLGPVIGGAFVGGLIIGFVAAAIGYEKRWLEPWYVWRSRLGPYSRSYRAEETR